MRRLPAIPSSVYQVRINLLARWLGTRVHYAWVALGLAFLTLLCAAAVRASPAVLIVPLEQAFG